MLLRTMYSTLLIGKLLCLAAACDIIVFYKVPNAFDFKKKLCFTMFSKLLIANMLFLFTRFPKLLITTRAVFYSVSKLLLAQMLCFTRFSKPLVANVL